MGPYGAHHAPESIQFSCLSCTSSYVSGSKSVWRACAQIRDSFSVFKSCTELDCSKLKVKSKTGEAKRSSLVFQWTKLLKLLLKGIFSVLRMSCSFATTRGVVRDRLCSSGPPPGNTLLLEGKNYFPVTELFLQWGVPGSSDGPTLLSFS